MERVSIFPLLFRFKRDGSGFDFPVRPCMAISLLVLVVGQSAASISWKPSRDMGERFMCVHRSTLQKGDPKGSGTELVYGVLLDTARHNIMAAEVHMWLRSRKDLLWCCRHRRTAEENLAKAFVKWQSKKRHARVYMGAQTVVIDHDRPLRCLAGLAPYGFHEMVAAEWPVTGMEIPLDIYMVEPKNRNPEGGKTYFPEHPFFCCFRNKCNSSEWLWRRFLIWSSPCKYRLQKCLGLSLWLTRKLKAGPPLRLFESSLVVEP